ncbi:HEPN domain-containing protein [Pyrobaculum sp. 3827-6]|uniref:HEPN domain-containing protein n=1 Tax=Pyrobaculum sp. 3827-6 TaxID=2983604 RepID=UPI0021D9EF3A|nr:HEPN domain-containing protein [Pyrobaculum sp. 3827-6]MCU7787740.1 HEPN domain-containing protein [Pyrobaculum sp. 3827-6]
MREEALVWFRETVKGCLTAKMLLEAGVFHSRAFFSHQAAEKALKSLFFVLARKEPPKRHNLLELYRELRRYGVELSPQLVEGLAVVTKYYATSRYPDAAGGPPSELFTKREAEYALEVARELIRLASLTYGEEGC